MEVAAGGGGGGGGGGAAAAAGGGGAPAPHVPAPPIDELDYVSYMVSKSHFELPHRYAYSNRNHNHNHNHNCCS